MDQNHIKGLEGEKYIAAKLAEFGYTVLYVGGCQLYSITGGRFYCVDLEAFKGGKTFWVQAKKKPPRGKYPDTGMELYQYLNLIKHQKESGLPVLVLFTDDSQKIYGDWLDNLPGCFSMQQFNNKDKRMMIYWLLDKLKDYHDLI